MTLRINNTERARTITSDYNWTIPRWQDYRIPQKTTFHTKFCLLKYCLCVLTHHDIKQYFSGDITHSHGKIWQQEHEYIFTDIKHSRLPDKLLNTCKQDTSVTARNSLNKLSVLLTYSHQCCTLTKYHTISKTIIHCKAQIKTAPTITMIQPYTLEIYRRTCGGKTRIWSICVELLMCCAWYGQWQLPNSVTKCCHMKSSVLQASKKTRKLTVSTKTTTPLDTKWWPKLTWLWHGLIAITSNIPMSEWTLALIPSANDWISLYW